MTTQTASEKDYLRTEEVARLFRVSDKTISRWARQGKLPHDRTLGGHRRFPAARIRELVRQIEESGTFHQ